MTKQSQSEIATPFGLAMATFFDSECKLFHALGNINAIAELYRAGIIDKSGRFRDYIQTPRLKRVNGKLEFVIAWENETCIGREITITQQDVRNVQLAKEALYTGAKLMMKKLGIEKLDKIALAGAFGGFINVKNAMIL